MKGYADWGGLIWGLTVMFIAFVVVMMILRALP